MGQLLKRMPNHGLGQKNPVAQANAQIANRVVGLFGKVAQAGKIALVLVKGAQGLNFDQLRKGQVNAFLLVDLQIMAAKFVGLNFLFEHQFKQIVMGLVGLFEHFAVEGLKIAQKLAVFLIAAGGGFFGEVGELIVEAVIAVVGRPFRIIAAFELVLLFKQGPEFVVDAYPFWQGGRWAIHRHTFRR